MDELEMLTAVSAVMDTIENWSEDKTLDPETNRKSALALLHLGEAYDAIKALEDF